MHANITTSPFNEAVFEFWQDSKKLTIYVDPLGGIHYVKVWGPDMDEEMEDGYCTDNSELLNLWTWLKS